MEKTTSKIFKKGTLDFKAPVKINSINSIPTGADKPNENHQISVDANAILVEKNENFSIIEVTCSCGKKLHLKCNHEYQKQ